MNEFYNEQMDTGEMASIAMMAQYMKKVAMLCEVQTNMSGLHAMLHKVGERLQSLSVHECEVQLKQLLVELSEEIASSEVKSFHYRENRRADLVILDHKEGQIDDRPSKRSLLIKERIANIKIRNELGDKSLLHYLNQRFKKEIEKKKISEFNFVDLQKVYGPIKKRSA